MDRIRKEIFSCVQRSYTSTDSKYLCPLSLLFFNVEGRNYAAIDGHLAELPDMFTSPCSARTSGIYRGWLLPPKRQIFLGMWSNKIVLGCVSDPDPFIFTSPGSETATRGIRSRSNLLPCGIFGFFFINQLFFGFVTNKTSDGTKIRHQHDWYTWYAGKI